MSFAAVSFFLRRGLFAGLLMLAPLAASAAQTLLPVASLPSSLEVEGQGEPLRAAKQAVPELAISILTIIGATAAGGAAWRRRPAL